MVDFIKAIEIGIKAAEDKESNLKEIREIISEVNLEINKICGFSDGFIRLSGDSFICNHLITNFEYNHNYGYPVNLSGCYQDHICYNADELVSAIKSIISTSQFGSMIRRFKNENCK